MVATKDGAIYVLVNCGEPPPPKKKNNLWQIKHRLG